MSDFTMAPRAAGCMVAVCERGLKLTFHDADTDILADFRARIVHEPDTHEDPRRLVRHTCTRLQNYTIGAFLISASVPWNSSLMLFIWTTKQTLTASSIQTVVSERENTAQVAWTRQGHTTPPRPTGPSGCKC